MQETEVRRFADAGYILDFNRKSILFDHLLAQDFI